MSQKVIPGEPQTGKISAFAGRSALYGLDDEGNPRFDPGMTKTEGLALFEPQQAPGALDPKGTPLFLFPLREGLGHSLNAEALYCAMRWDYGTTSKDNLRKARLLIEANEKGVFARPVDWGPNEETTDKLVDASPGVLHALGIKSGDFVRATLILS